MSTTDTEVSNLIVNKLTLSKYKELKIAGTLSETESYEITDIDTAIETGSADAANRSLSNLNSAGQAVLDAKANDSDVVKTSGNQTIAGAKTFTSQIKATLASYSANSGSTNTKPYKKIGSCILTGIHQTVIIPFLYSRINTMVTNGTYEGKICLRVGETAGTLSIASSGIVLSTYPDFIQNGNNSFYICYKNNYPESNQVTCEIWVYIGGTYQGVNIIPIRVGTGNASYSTSVMTWGDNLAESETLPDGYSSKIHTVSSVYVKTPNTSDNSSNVATTAYVKAQDYASNSIVATGSTTSRILADRFADVVNVKDFGAKGDGITDDTESIQKAINYAIVNNKGCVLLPNGQYKLTKTTDTTVYPNNDGACLYVKDANNLVIIGENSTLSVNMHGQTILEIINSKNITVENLELMGYGLFPQQDTSTGLAEKGDSTGGYFDGTHYFPFFKNNSIDTSNYKGFARDPNYVWGSFGNGNIGSMGDGILIYDGCENIYVKNCEISGFNYAGVCVGITPQIPNNYTDNENIKIKNCVIHDIYDRGISIEQSKNNMIEGCTIYNIGHPDDMDFENTGWQKAYLPDPGYGISLSKGKFYPKNTSVRNCNIKKATRCGFDSHNCDGLIVDNCYFEYCPKNSINVSDGAQSAQARISDKCVISNNRIYKSGRLRVVATGHTYPDTKVDTIVKNNILAECFSKEVALIVAECSNINICNNIIKDIWDIGEDEPGAVYLGIQGSQLISKNIFFNNNIIDISNNNNDMNVVQCRTLENSIISGNSINVNQAGALILQNYCGKCIECNNILNTVSGTAKIQNYSATDENYIFNNKISLNGVDTGDSFYSTDLISKDAILKTLYSNAAYIGLKNGWGLKITNSICQPAYANQSVSDNEKNLGTSNARWKEIFCANATINTSDERLKQDIKDIPDKVLDVWSEINFCQFKFNNAVSEKGEKARIHMGLIAQRIKNKFEEHNINAFDYGLLCYDEWEAEEEEKDENGNIIRPAIKAGNRYSLRYEECLCVEAAYQRRRADKIEERLEALEAKLK